MQPPRSAAIVSKCAAPHGAAIKLSVTDDGEGIPAEALPRVFERFYRSDSARSRDRGGGGIGLTIAGAITEAHGGALRAESEGLGYGTRFVCALPIGGSGA